VIRVLLAEDSAVTREFLTELLAREPDLSVVGVAADGAEAVALAARLRPDVVLMDARMPRLDGYAAARRIMERAPAPIVMISGASSELGAEGGFKALEAGALVLLEKPPWAGHPEHDAAARELTQTLRLMAEVKVVRHRPPADGPAAPAPVGAPRFGGPGVIAIGASTGGPPVVAALLARIGAVPCPILLVQHISAAFTAGFAGWLDATTPFTVTVARAGERAAPGTVYVAPAGQQMGIAISGRIVLEPGDAGEAFRPSASHLFRSVARAYGFTAVGVLLTGMGRDGADGLLRMREAGALTIAQDEASSAVFGMPGEAVRLGAAAHVLPPERIAATIRRLAAPAPSVEAS
jgi:two-component system, chemotaxis family, protein-glutamate methylesterase/glutaminase